MPSSVAMHSDVVMQQISSAVSLLGVVCVQYIEALCITVNTDCSPIPRLQWPGYETAQIEKQKIRSNLL